ncbi:MAG: ACP S-malonyltransferase [Victivallaceae bacterium]|nr:ACP S-malonyltransferase [Victivallaceae bacterium]
MGNAFFVFSGQGAQTVGMGRDLYEEIPEAKAVFDQADLALGFPLTEIIFNGPAEKLTESRYCQTAIYTMSCAALAAFRARFPEVKIDGCAGLSLGEYAALHAAGSFSFAEGLKLLARRGELMDKACKASEGGMATALGGEVKQIVEVAARCGVDVANYNSPGQTVLSGGKTEILAAVEMLKAQGLRKVVVLNVAGAFHSRLMQPAANEFAGDLAAAQLVLPKVPVYQNYTADTPKSTEELRENLAKQISGSVRWEECVRKLAAHCDTMIEFGPGNVLTGLMRRTIPEVRCFNINTLDSFSAFAL